MFSGLNRADFFIIFLLQKLKFRLAFADICDIIKQKGKDWAKFIYTYNPLEVFSDPASGGITIGCGETWSRAWRPADNWRQSAAIQGGNGMGSNGNNKSDSICGKE